MKINEILLDAVETKCQTSDVIYKSNITSKKISITAELPSKLNLTNVEAKILEANLHNSMELVLSKYFYQSNIKD